MRFFIGLIPVITACVFASSCAPPVKDYSTPNFPGPRSSPYYFGFLGHADSTLAAFKLNTSTGQVTHNGYVVVGDGAATVSTFTVHPAGKWGYAETSEGIFLYAIDPVSGRLSLTAGPYPAAVPSGGLTLGTIDPRGTKFYAASNASGVIYGFTINPSDGTLTPMPGVFVYSGTGAGSQPVGITMNQTGIRLYVANAGDSTISTFSINGDASLTPLQQTLAVGSGTEPQLITVHPNGNWAYVPDNANSAVYAFSLTSNGALQPMDATGGGVPGTPQTLLSTDCTAPVEFTINSAGTFGYMACDTSNTVTSYAINPSNGAIAPNATANVSTGSNNPQTVTLSADENFAYVPTKNGNVMLVGKLDQSTGSITPAGSLLVRGNPILFTTVEPPAPVDLVTSFGYDSDYNTSSVYSFSIDSNSAALTPIGSPLLTGGTIAQYLALDPTGRFLYVPNESSANVSAFSIDSTTGTLTSLGTAPASGAGLLIGSVVDPSGRFLYISDQTGAAIYGYSIDSNTGALTALAAPLDTGLSTSPGTQPSSLAIDPSGQFLYSGNLTSNDISAWQINPSTGQLTDITGGTPYPTDLGPRGVIVDPSGSFVYAAGDTNGTVSAFQITASSGVLAPVTGTLATSTYAADAGTYDVKLTPNGAYLYAPNNNANTVSMYSVDSSSGALTPLTPPTVSSGVAPDHMEVDPTGKFAFSSDQSGNDISSYSIDPTSGNLTQVSTHVSGGTSPQSFVARGVLTLQ